MHATTGATGFLRGDRSGEAHAIAEGTANAREKR